LASNQPAHHIGLQDVSNDAFHSHTAVSAIPDLLRGTRYLSTCGQVETVTLLRVYLKLTYLLPLINYLIAFIVRVSMTM